jgi:hypothetical protein
MKKDPPEDAMVRGWREGFGTRADSWESCHVFAYYSGGSFRGPGLVSPRAGGKLSKMSRVLVIIMLLFSVVQSSCFVRERRAPPCRGGVFVQGHYGPRGRWHPEHWRCPGQREVIEID